jgi:F-type H+-transporting ATPase subunit b
VRLDWTTLLFETINFLVLMAILWRVLYRPLRKAIEARRARVAEELAQAEAAREDAERRQAAWKAREAELATLREETRRSALEEAERERVRLLERAREDAQAERARVAQLLETEREAAARWLESTVWKRGTDLAGRMLLALAPADIDRLLGERLTELLATRPEALERVQQEWGEGAVEVELAGARRPDGPWLASLEAALAEALGRKPRVALVEDESLVAGFVLRLGDVVFDASVAGELSGFRELARELDAA